MRMADALNDETWEKKMAIDVSVVIPCYNDGKYIEQAVSSVEPERKPDVEIIVVDDGSDDPATLQILEKLRLQGVQVMRSSHEGPSGARNMGIAKARGRYILPLDADDRIESAYIDAAKKLLDADDTLGIVYCHADLFGAEKGPWRLPDYSLDQMLIDNIVFVTAMFRREDWVRVGGFRTDMEWGMEDYDFFLSILELDRSICQLPDIYFHYRIRKKSRTERYKRDFHQVEQTYERIYEHHRALYQKHMELYVKTLRAEVIRHRYNHQRLIEKSGVLRMLFGRPAVKRLMMCLVRR